MQRILLILFTTLLASCLADVNPIVGGQDARAGEFPYQVAFAEKIGTSWYQFCGGSLIHPEWVLTAAHCIGGPPTGRENRVVIGVTNLSEVTASSLYSISDVHRYPGYVDYRDKDVALVHLSSPVVFNQYQTAVEIAGEFFPDALQTAPTPANVSGWGVLVAGQSTGGSVGSGTDALQWVTVPLVSKQVCLQYYPRKITDRMVCAGIQGKDSCQGDSGGPLVVQYQGRTVQIGIVSWGDGCAVAPGVYTKVSSYYRWIQAIMNQTAEVAVVPIQIAEVSFGSLVTPLSALVAVVALFLTACM